VSGSAIHTPQQLQLTTPPQCTSLLYRCLAVAACSRQPLDCHNRHSITQFKELEKWLIRQTERQTCSAHNMPICLSIHPSVCINRKWLKLVLYNFHQRQSHPSLVQATDSRKQWWSNTVAQQSQLWSAQSLILCQSSISTIVRFGSPNGMDAQITSIQAHWRRDVQIISSVLSCGSFYRSTSA